MKTRREFLVAMPLLIWACTNPKKREMTKEEIEKLKSDAQKYHQEIDKKLVSEGHPIAVTLKYRMDGLSARVLMEKSKSIGVPPEQQICSTCVFYKTIGDDYGSCQMLPMGNVTSNGWCMSWAMSRSEMPNENS